MFDRRFVLAVAAGALFPPVFAAALLSVLQPYSRFVTPVAPVQLTFVQASAATAVEPSTPPAEKTSDISFAAHAWSPPSERPKDEGAVLKEKAEVDIPIARTTEPEPLADREGTELMPVQQEPVVAKNTASVIAEEPQESRELVAKEPGGIPPSQTVELEDSARPKMERPVAATVVAAADQEPATQSRGLEEKPVTEHVLGATPSGPSSSAPHAKAGSAGVSRKSPRLVRKVVAKPASKPSVPAAKKVAIRQKAREKIAARPAKKPKAIPILARGGGVEQGTWNSAQWTYWNSYHPYQF
jgi:hypothetical protein